MNWLDEYRTRTELEKKILRDDVYNVKQKTLALEYDRMINTLKNIAENPMKHTNSKVNHPEEIALSFMYEALTISEKLYSLGLIDLRCKQEMIHIKHLFELINSDPQNNWTLDYMIHDNKWKNIRKIANTVLYLLNEPTTSIS